MKVSFNGRIPDGIIIPEGRLLAAFSGGSDSLFLLSVLSRLAPERTEAIYVDHSIRSRDELEKEIELNRRNADMLGIPLSVERIPDGEVASYSRRRKCGIEAAARALRYRILQEKADREGFDHILTAHHREDQVETVLMRLLSGSPFYSWQGILRSDGRIFRPLLDVPKEDILSYLRAEGLEWSEDSTNSDTGFLRSSIRHSILPLINERERQLLSSIADNTALFRRRFPSIPSDDGFFTEVDRAAFIEALPMQRDELIFRTLSRAGVSERISRELVEAVDAKAVEGRGRLYASGFAFFFSGRSIRIYPPIDDFVVECGMDGAAYGSVSLTAIEPDPQTLVIDPERLKPPVILRTAREGDRIHLKDGEKLVSSLEKDFRIPYSLVLEDRSGIVAFFSRFLGGRDRLASRLLSDGQRGIGLAIRVD